MSNDIVKFPKRSSGNGGDSTGPGPAPATSLVQVVKTRFLQPDVSRRRLRPALELALRGSALRPCLDHRSKAAVPIAMEWLETIPPVPVLKALQTEFELVVSHQAADEEITILVAWAIEAFPNRPASVDAGFAETVQLLLEDPDEPLSAASIASGVRDLISRTKFMPVASEILDAAMVARRRFQGAAMRIEHLIDLRASAEDTAFMAGKMSRADYGVSSDPDEVPF